MSIVSKEFLSSIGVILDDQSYSVFAAHFDETLIDRIIESILDILEDEQVDQLAELKDSADSEALWQWVQSAVPELGEIIQEEIDILLGEIAENSDRI